MQVHENGVARDSQTNHSRLTAMASTRDLTEMTAEQLQEFLDSFDVVLSDCDGVLWRLQDPIPGAMQTVNRLKELGKKVYLVTNNSTIGIDQYCEKMGEGGLKVKPDDIINTAKVISWYLKKINFRDEVFLIATTPFRQILLENGIKLGPENLEVTEWDQAATVKTVLGLPSIKAVIVDFSIFFDWAKLAFAISCLKRKDVLYLTGAQDEWIICGHNIRVLGSGPLIDIITTKSGRTPIQCAKPSEVLKEYVLKNCEVKDPKRCLIIGDTIQHDMKFGTLCGFTKLFVDTGLDKIEEATQNQEVRPDFYIPSLGMLCPILDSLQNPTVNGIHS
ncbi:4-nitrophenylphosphatase-like [Colletes gigas]|uniref:4-nitrophenylphosphatase-like n=1 Tax=Colletes gigas TaxID=935657 RepID=UPI001C9B3C59|nr:4-nitrophenylphosphatase-like [Colletes gigas]